MTKEDFEMDSFRDSAGQSTNNTGKSIGKNEFLSKRG